MFQSFKNIKNFFKNYPILETVVFIIWRDDQFVKVAFNSAKHFRQKTGDSAFVKSSVITFLYTFSNNTAWHSFDNVARLYCSNSNNCRNTPKCVLAISIDVLACSKDILKSYNLKLVCSLSSGINQIG